MNSLRKVIIMLSINTECYITPEQSGDILVALDEYSVMRNAKDLERLEKYHKAWVYLRSL